VTVLALRTALAERLAAPPLLGVMIAVGAAVYVLAVWLLNRELAREALDSVRHALRAPGAGGWLPDRR